MYLKMTSTKTSDTSFRAKAEPAAPEVMPKGITPDRSADEGKREEVPFTDYKGEHHHPYTVDYFKLGETWDDPTGGFPKEIGLIESYLKDKIERGELLNETKEVEKRIKEMEKVAGVKDESRKIVKIEALAGYVKFLMGTDETKYKVEHYGNN